jgi:plastocyanin
MQISLRVAGAFLVAVGLVLAGALIAAASPAAPAPITVAVLVGGGSADGAVQADLYFPGTVTIDEGDRLTWADNAGADESHTVTFGRIGPCVDLAKLGVPAPGTSYSGTGCVSSGALWPAAAPAGAGPKTYTLTFPQAGTYKYFCQFHQPAMAGTVVVQPAGAAYPAGQGSYAAAKDPAFAAALRAGQAALAAQKVTTATNADGTTTYTMNAGSGDGKSFSLYRFGAGNLAIHAGDKVTWIQTDLDDFHTVTFLANGQDIPFSLPNGDPNPVAVSRTRETAYTGTGLVNSGLLVPAPAPLEGRTYSLTFPRPGTYGYVCLIHDDAGMKGTIRVLATVPAALPRTGGLPAGAIVAAGLLGLLFGGGGLALSRRSHQSGA